MATYMQRRYVLMTTDPVHIGTGGYRLGRVDNSIVREPGTRVPKIPGSSLHGAIRSYAARLFETPEAAGQTQDSVEEPDWNPVCYTFGYIKNEEKQGDKVTRAYAGVINVFDAHIVLFPVYSMVGPVWVSTPGRLTEAGFKVSHIPEQASEGDNAVDDKADNNRIRGQGEPAYGSAFLTWAREDPLNLGWLMVKVEKQVTVRAPSAWGGRGSGETRVSLWEAVKHRIVLVPESLFAHVVNSNLEVRTSVAINPETGAAEEKALFTYEAIPRTTFLILDVILDDYREAFPSEARLERIRNRLKKVGNRGEKEEELETQRGRLDRVLAHVNKLKEQAPRASNWRGPWDVVEAGLDMIAWLGVGGMGTRGFGRLVRVGRALESTPGENLQPTPDVSSAKESTT